MNRNAVRSPRYRDRRPESPRAPVSPRSRTSASTSRKECPCARVSLHLSGHTRYLRRDAGAGCRRHSRETACDRRPLIQAGRAALLAAGILTAAASPALSQIAAVEGQASLTLAWNDTRPGLFAGLRYIPALSLNGDLGRGWTVGLEAAADALGSGRAFASGSGDPADLRIDAYRLWARLASAQFEARVGLQKINFGSAQLLRPLMWFDRLDPNDPLQLTDGVKAMLLRYTFLNNANVWLWGLLDNGAKGWEIYPSRRTAPEFGGRVQVPVPAGELAATYHHRRLDASRGPLPLPGERPSTPEDRLGLDGKWDTGAVGVWFEGTIVRQDFRAYPFPYQRLVTVGADATIGVGNGLGILAEHLTTTSSTGWREGGPSRNFTALSADYPLGLLDRVRAVVYRDWTADEWYRILTWQRTYDRWTVFVIGFWNPDQYRLYESRTETTLFAGRGLQVTAAFNH